MAFLVSVTTDENVSVPSCQSDIEFNIVEYMACFIVRSISTKLTCEDCVVALRTDNNNTSMLSLIAIKDRGGLV